MPTFFRTWRYFCLGQLCSWSLELRKYVLYFVGIILFSNSFYPYRTHLQNGIHPLLLLSIAFVWMLTYPQQHSAEWGSPDFVSWTLLALNFVPQMATQLLRRNSENFSPGCSIGYVIPSLTTPPPHHGSFAWSLPIRKPSLCILTINGYQMDLTLLELLSLLRPSLGLKTGFYILVSLWPNM